MDIAVWKNSIKETVQNIADGRFQEQACFGKSDQISSPDELYNSLFDDLLFSSFLESKEIGLTREQQQLGVKLRNSLEEYSPQGEDLPSPYDMIEDPKWVRVRDVANTFAKSL